MSHRGPFDRHILMSRDEPTDLETMFGGAWREHRRYVLDVALRMLGDLGEAEDVVQEAFIRLARTDLDEIDDVRAWLLTVVSRLCLDQLRSARRQRQQPLDDAGDGLAPLERIASSAAVDPADRVTLDDSVRLALTVMLERLTPSERTAFVLHDVFQLSFDDIAGIVGRSVDACRQLASRARRHLASDGDPARFVVATSEQHNAATAFITAATTGDLDGLLAVLDPDVDGEVDLGGGKRGAGGQRGGTGVTRLRNAARGILRYVGPGSGVTLLSLPTGPQPSILAVRDGEAVAVLTITVRGDRIGHIHVLADPARLASITAALGG
jgi:RNA polymerase sigma-70 factor (ECF subfamily)